ncbi:MAG: RDD family protein [Methylophagaceae bacterium]
MNQDWRYPRFLRRLQAVAIDNVILAVLFMSGLLLASYVGITGRDAIILIIAITLLWEPLFITITGGTIGHHLLGLKVVSKKTGENLNIFVSVARFTTKFLLGLFSVAFIFITRYHQAIHDGLARSVVLIKHPETKPAYEVLSERQHELPSYSYPPVWRRSIMIVLYNAALILMIGTTTGFLLPAACLTQGDCSVRQDIILTVWQLLWVVGVVVITTLCWKGLLFGCRRKIRKGSEYES